MFANLSAALLFLWVVTGGAISSAIMIRVWSRDPIPGVTGRFIGVIVVGAIAGGLGGVLFHTSDPMPGIVGAAALSTIVSSLVVIASSRPRAAARGAGQ